MTRSEHTGDHRPVVAEILALGLVGAVVAVTLPALYRYQGPPMEEGFMLAFPEQILKGSVPHRDFLHLYGPGSLWLLAGVYKVLGVTIQVERTVGLFQHLLLTYAIYAVIRPFGRRMATAGSVLSFVILIAPAGLTAMAWNGGLAFGMTSIALGGRAAVSRENGTRWAIASGLCAGTALLFRPDLVIAMGLGWVAMWLTMAGRERIALTASTVAAGAAYLIHFAMSGFGPAFRGMVLEPVFELRPGRTLPVPPSWDHLDGFLQRGGLLRDTGWPFPMLSPAHQNYLWFWLVPISIVVVLVGAHGCRRSERDLDPHLRSRSVLLWPAALFGAGLITQALQRPDSTHLAWVSGITFPLMIPAIYSILANHGPWRSVTTRRRVALTIPAVILITVIPFYPVRSYTDLVSQSLGFDHFGHPVTRDDRTFYLGDPETAAAAQRITDALDSRARPGQRLITGPTDMSRTNYNDAYFYYLFPDLDAGTRYIEMDPGLADANGSGLADELRNNDWLIVSDVWSNWSEPNESLGSRSHDADEVIADLYCKVAVDGPFTLKRRCRD